MKTVLEVSGLTKIYQSGERHLKVLDAINFSLQQADTCAIVGPSGSGKTTLMGICAGLDKPTSGNVLLNGINLGSLTEDGRAKVRNEYVGFVFQNFQLIPTLTALENVLIPLELRGEKVRHEEAIALLEKVSLKDRMNHYPVQLSGGEQQRVALARAFINRPMILFADEPTGNLDTETSKAVEALLFALNKEAGTTLVLVTHDMELAEKTGRIMKIKGGKMVFDSAKAAQQIGLENVNH
ncbi:ABC transporter-related protein [Chloroherpeton thalassium ATCC 35110]|uniref:ABC transporter-related protein n=1 Tax=Chloroherpeton thalassium (strain ATCC 35110 / GB-78) TaxID=517418 RepID=B3QTC6_CHLT3|nr:ABC transporter ATP-binding protein [Chloroherpeton thalassium]ACF14225.1 ABC transporter-related protein [Chloroherpeton thalassium ATCC 35110]